MNTIRPVIPGLKVMAVALGISAYAASHPIAHQTTPAVVGLDHVTIGVNDLEQAATHYRRLGFALKPGRPHANGIRNEHVKFPDGTELELITAPENRDALTAAYRRHLAAATARRSSRSSYPTVGARRRSRRPRSTTCSSGPGTRRPPIVPSILRTRTPPNP